ncbi:MAG: hypothetical protein IJB55_02485 [Firmicutes bacterium]|nr:hypothetical protein [Bacillota bacterium]
MMILTYREAGQQEISAAGLNEALLAVRSELGRVYQPYAGALEAQHRPVVDWFSYELVPVLVLLPNDGGRDARMLAVAMELCCLGGLVHDKGGGTAHMPGRSVLTGDYLYALGALRLAAAGYDDWLGSVGRVLCRRSEARLVRLDWVGRSFVPESEKIANLHKENAEAMSLAAQMAVERLDWPEVHKRAYAEFGFYLGILQGIVQNGYDVRGYEYTEALELCRSALAVRPELAAAAETFILERFERYGETRYDKKYHDEKGAAQEMA